MKLLNSVASPDHLGLAVKTYRRFTALNRRYPDLILQRLPKALLRDAALPYAAGDLALLSPVEGRIVAGESGVDVGDLMRVRLTAVEPVKG